METSRDQLEAVAEGEAFDRYAVLVIERITVHYRLRLPTEHHAEAERVHGFHARACPGARRLKGRIEVRTTLELL